MAAGRMLGHSDPVATVMQAGDGHPGLIHHGNRNMATRASSVRTNPNQTLRWLLQKAEWVRVRTCENRLVHYNVTVKAEFSNSKREGESTKVLHTPTYINTLNPSCSSLRLAGSLTLDLFLLREAVQPLDCPVDALHHWISFFIPCSPGKT